MPERSASTSWLWIVSKFTWRAWTKSPVAELAPVPLEDPADHHANRVLDEARL